ncbi:MAG: asparagine synthase (glutamine-hydrolyzing) [Chitinophagaceae bacterium]
MCGIIGEVGSQMGSKEQFFDLRQLMHQRGPDMDGYHSDEQRFRFGFKRLAILDLSMAGNQPMLSRDGHWVMLMNGEVYNYKELHAQIGSPPLRSGTDTEVVLEVFLSLGFVEGIKRLNGMFAISLYHIPTGKLYLGRDFAGIKPLYYGIRNNTLIFGSQFNQVFKHALYQRKLNLRPEIMREYFAFGYQHAPNTVFQDIWQLKPGEYLVWDNVSCQLETKSLYYQWQENPINFETNADMPAQTNSILQQVVKSQLHADVPVATFLSGGIDSPLITAHAVKQYNRIEAFTVKVDDKKFNESEIAKRYAEQLNVKQIIESFTEDELVQVVDEHFQHIPEPMGDYSSIPTYLITKRARKYATVMLSGDGGDELFWGYPRFLYFSQQAHYFNWPLRLRKLAMPLLRRFKPNLTHALDVVENIGDMNIHKHIHNRHTQAIFPKVDFSEELKQDYVCDTADAEPTLQYLRKNEFYAHMQRVLRKVDLMSMANSLEVRVPFLDEKVISFALKIQPQLGISHTQTKYLLKECLSEFVPKSIIQTKKRGFSVPIEQWMHHQLKNDIIDYLIDRPIYGAKHMQHEALRKQVLDFFNHKKGNAWGIWHMYAWQKWAKANDLI